MPSILQRPQPLSLLQKYTRRTAESLFGDISIFGVEKSILYWAAKYRDILPYRYFCPPLILTHPQLCEYPSTISIHWACACCCKQEADCILCRKHYEQGRIFTESSWSAKHCKTAILSLFSVIVLLKSFCLFGNISNITSILLTNKQKNLSFSCKMFQLPFHVYERPKCIENLSLNTRIHAASDWACAGQFKHSGLLLTGVRLVLFVAIHPKTSATG